MKTETICPFPPNVKPGFGEVILNGGEEKPPSSSRSASSIGRGMRRKDDEIEEDILGALLQNAVKHFNFLVD